MKGGILGLFLVVLIQWSFAQQDLYSVTKIQQLAINFPTDDWQSKLIQLKDAGQKERTEANITLNGIPYAKVGVRFKGNSSYNSAKKDFNRKLPFNIKSNFVDKSQLFGEHKTIKLANGFRDPSMVREILAYEILANYMPAPKANFMQVTVNGKAYGLYTNVESIDSKFVKDNYGVENQVFIKCDQEYTIKRPSNCPKNSKKPALIDFGNDTTCFAGVYELKSDYGYKKLRKLIVLLNKFPEKIESILNVDQTLWMLAYNNVLVNLDSYSGVLSHNWYLAEDVEGRLNPLVWDLNLAFGGFTFDGSKKGALTSEEMQQYSLFAHFKDKDWPLINLLLKNPRYRKIYIAHAKTIYEDVVANDWYYKRAQELQQIADAAIKSDASKFYSYNSFKNNMDKSTKAGRVQIVGLKELMEGRKNYLKNHKLFNTEAPVIKAQVKTLNADEVTISANVTGANMVFLKYRTKEQAIFKTLKLEKNTEGKYEGKLNKNLIDEYYILAENKAAVSLLPRRAAYAFFEIQ